jgi:hypothetical protein
MNEQLAAKQNEQLSLLGQIVNQNPIAASGLKGAQKATEEIAYEAVKGGAKDVNEVLADLVQKFGGGAVQAKGVPQGDMSVKTEEPGYANQMVYDPTGDRGAALSGRKSQEQEQIQETKEPSELQSAAMELVKGQSEKLPLFERMQRGALLSIGIDPDDALKGLGGKTKQLANIKTAQEIMGEVPAQAKDIAMKVLEFKLKAGEEKNLKPEQILNKFEPVANAYQTIVDSYDRVVASGKDPSPAGDLALIFNYMKILDPGSTVREGEFATAENSASIPEKIRNWYNKAATGKRLGDVDGFQREDFIKRAGMLFDAKEKQYQSSEKEFKRIAEKNGIDPEKVLRKVERSPMGESKFTPTPEQARAELERRKKQKGI